MPINVLLIGSSHHVVATLHPVTNLAQLLPAFNERKSSCYLSAIDQYADTFFNDLQIDGFLGEWRALDSGQLKDEEKATLQAIEELALRARDEHLVLKFEGD